MPDNRMLQTILDKVSSVEQKVDSGFKSVDRRFDETNKRIDKIGLQLASLEDDTPTIKEFDQLEGRVEKLEQIAT